MTDSAPLVEALARLAPTARTSPQLAHFNPQSGWYKQIAAQHVDESDGGVQEITQLLRSRGTFAAYENGYVRYTPNSSSSFHLKHVANWCLAQARHRAPSDVIAQLNEFVYRNELRLDEIIALWGLTPERPLDLGDNVTLRSLADLPASQIKDLLTGVPETLHTGSTAFPKRPRPTAVLTSSRTMRPVFLPPGPQKDTPTNTGVLQDIASCLCLVADASVCEIAGWFQCDVSTPVVGGVRGWGGRTVEREFHRMIPPRPIDESRARTVVSEFLGLDRQVRDRLMLPLRRLNVAMRRDDPTDVALELGIALEALLTGKEPYDAPIAYRVRQRGAVLLAGTAVERRKHFEILKALYVLRSRAAHGETLSDRERVKGLGVTTRDLLHQGTKLCAEILRRLIQRGSLPDWDAYILGGENSCAAVACETPVVP